jgi:hypothetical protein
MDEGTKESVAANGTPASPDAQSLEATIQQLAALRTRKPYTDAETLIAQALKGFPASPQVWF